MAVKGIMRLKLVLTLEIAFAGIYLALTRSLLVIYLTSIGFTVGYISAMVVASSIASLILSIILYKFPKFMVRKVRMKFILAHAGERIFWIPIALTSNIYVITASYTVLSISSTVLGVFMNLLIYSSFDEAGIRDITAKRTAAYNLTNVIGLILSIFLLAILPPEIKFQTIFIMGSLIGLLSTAMITFADMSKMEEVKIPPAIERPEQFFSISSFLLAFLTSSNLLGIFWQPYLMNVLRAPDYVAAGINFAGTFASILGSALWAKRSLRTFRIALASSLITPIAAILIPIPSVHIGVSAFNGVVGTGAAFLGNFLFARYLSRFGILRSSIIMILLSNLSQLLATPFGIIFGQDYMILFISVLLLMISSNFLALLTIPEVAMVPAHAARTYSYLLYTTSLMGYSLIVETTVEAITLTLRLLALALILIILYILYRLVWFLATI